MSDHPEEEDRSQRELRMVAEAMITMFGTVAPSMAAERMNAYLALNDETSADYWRKLKTRIESILFATAPEQDRKIH